MVSLTEHGQQVHDRLSKQVALEFGATLDSFSNRDLEALRDVLGSLMSGIRGQTERILERRNG